MAKNGRKIEKQIKIKNSSTTCSVRLFSTTLYTIWLENPFARNRNNER